MAADGAEVVLRTKLVKAVYNFQPANTDELCFRKGDIISVTQQLDGGWWEGTLNGTTGWFPSNYVRDAKPTDVRAGAKSPTGAKVNETKPSSRNDAAYNRNVVLSSLVSTEREFTTELNDHLHQHLQPLESVDFLTTSEYADIIGNLPELAAVHKTLLSSLEESVQRVMTEQRVGGVLLHVAPHLQALYQKYSANHPRAAAVLQAKRIELSRYMEGLGCTAPGVMSLTQALSKPFRRLDRYSNLLKELERHTNESHPDRGDTQRAIAVYRDMALACSEIRKQKELEYEILHSEIRGWEGQELSDLGEVLLLTHAAVQVDEGESRDRLVLLFPSLLVLLSLTPRVSGYVFEGKLHVSSSNTTVNTVEDAENFSYSLEIAAGSSSTSGTSGGGGMERLTISCASVQEKNKWLTALRPYVKLAPTCFSPKQTASAAAAPQHQSSGRVLPSTTAAAAVVTHSITSSSQKPSAAAHHQQQQSAAGQISSVLTAYKHSPKKTSCSSSTAAAGAANLSCLRPGPPLRPSVLVKEDGSRSPRLTRRIIGPGRRKPVDDAKTLEEDAVMLQIIEGYCTSTKARQTVNSSLLENPQVLIAEEEKIIVEEVKDNQTVVEEKTLVDTVYSLKDQVKELKQEQQRLRRDLDNERRARKRLESMLRQSLKSIVENTFESSDTLTNASGST